MLVGDWLEKRCSKCNRVMARKQIGTDGEAWELQEGFNSFRPKCWPCGCSDTTDPENKFNNVRARHINLINYAAEKGCGC